MLKRHSRFFLSLLLLHDISMVMLAFVAAYLSLRFSLPSKRKPAATTRARFFWCALWCGRCARNWLASIARAAPPRSVTSSIACSAPRFRSWCWSYCTRTLHAASVTHAASTLLFVRRISRSVWSAAGATVFRRMLRSARARGYNLRHVLVVGSGPLAEKVVGLVHAHAELGLRVLGTVGASSVPGAALLGAASDISRVLRDGAVDQVIIALPIDELGALKTLMDQLSLETVDVRIVPDLYQFATLGHGIEEFGGLPMIALQDSPLYGWNSVLKRLFDIGVSIAVVVIFSPLYVFLALLVKTTEAAGPVFHLQERMGLDGRISLRCSNFARCGLAPKPTAARKWPRLEIHGGHQWDRSCAAPSLDAGCRNF